ncbi:hypothetical protein BH23CHL10_BH23CHL10_11540 [soil metagenome]
MPLRVAGALILVGIVILVTNPSWGLIPSFLLIVVGLVFGIMTLLGKGVAPRGSGMGPTKACPGCRSRNPMGATACRQCGYRYPQP